MQQQGSLTSILHDHDFRSKLTDGVLASAVLLLIWLVAALAARPIQVVFGLPGSMVYALGLLAVAMFSFQQSLISHRPDSVRAWYGTAGGLLVWSMIEVIGDLGLPMIPGVAGIIMLIAVSLIVGLLWRNFLPIGARFFALTVLLNWMELIVISAQSWLSGFSPAFTPIYRVTGYLALGGMAFILGWILFRTRRRIQRIGGALFVSFLGSLAISVFFGSLF